MTGIMIFDMFGVIARNQSAMGQERLAFNAGIGEAARPAFWDAYWRLRPPYDQGLLSGIEYWNQVASALDKTFSDEQIAELITVDIASWSTVDDAMVDLLGELASSGIRLALLSNIPQELAVHYENNHRWLDIFDLVAFSCRIGQAKPEPAAFEWCLKALDTRADQALFIDDRRDNVEAAETLGIRGHLFTSPERLREHLGLG